MILFQKKLTKKNLIVSILYLYILVENLSLKNKNLAHKTNPTSNNKYINDIKAYHDRVQSSQISYDEYKLKNKDLNKKQNIKLKEGKNKNINNNIYNKNNEEINNPGLRLYKQNIEHESKKVQKLKEKLLEEQKKEDLKLTFKPQINEYSRKLVENNYKGIKIENRLINYGKMYKERNKSKENIIDKNSNNNINKSYTTRENNETKIKHKRIRTNITPDKNLNYLTNINKNNIQKNKSKPKFISNDKNTNNNKMKHNKLKRNLTPDNSVYEQLYLESKILRKKRDDEIQKNLDLTCPFKPKLNDSYNKNIKMDNLNVFERLYDTKNENQRLKTEIKLRRKFMTNLENNYNDYNQIKKPIKTNNNLKTYIQKKRSTLNEDNSYINSINNNINSDNIDKSEFNNENKKNYYKKSLITILKAKYIKYVELFNCLDSDKDGIISYKKIKLTNLDSDKLISLTPILYEIQYKGMKIDFPKFCEKIKNLN